MARRLRRSLRIIMTDEARVLRQMRIDKGLSMAKAGRLMGWSDSYISHIEHGRVDPPNGERLDRMLKVYGDITRKSYIEKIRRFKLNYTPAEDLAELVKKLSPEQTMAVLTLVKQFINPPEKCQVNLEEQ